MITRVEFSTLALDGPTPMRERKDFASDMVGVFEGFLFSILGGGCWICTEYVWAEWIRIAVCIYSVLAEYCSRK